MTKELFDKQPKCYWYAVIAIRLDELQKELKRVDEKILTEDQIVSIAEAEIVKHNSDENAHKELFDKLAHKWKTIHEILEN